MLLVERRASTSSLPRATHVSTRTMEIFRGWGVADAVRERSVRVLPAMSTARTLADAEHTTYAFGYPPVSEVLRRSPVWAAWFPQDYVEPLLAAHLRDVGGELAFGSELTDLAITDGGVRAQLGNGRQVHARYLVGADGPRSTVRGLLGIGTDDLGE